MEDVIVISGPGIIYTSVCAAAALTVEQVAEVINERHPTGISSRWGLSEESTFRTGEANPCACETHPDSRRHWLLAC